MLCLHVEFLSPSRVSCHRFRLERELSYDHGMYTAEVVPDTPILLVVDEEGGNTAEVRRHDSAKPVVGDSSVLGIVVVSVVSVVLEPESRRASSSEACLSSFQ